MGHERPNTNETPVVSQQNSRLYSSDILLFNKGNWLNDACISFLYERWQFLTKRYYPELEAQILLMDPAAVHWLQFENSEEELVAAAKTLQFRERKVVLMPVNHGNIPMVPNSGMHWTLLVYLAEDGKIQFIHFDSTAGRLNSETAAIVACKLTNLCCDRKNEKFAYHANASTPDIEQGLCVAQQNSWDCGMLVLLFSERILEIFVEQAAKGQFLSGVKQKIYDALLQVSPEDIELLRSRIIQTIRELTLG